MLQLNLPGFEDYIPYHDFRERLEYSEICTQDMPDFYLKAFSSLTDVEKCNDQSLQRQGIDHIGYQNGGHKLYFDEKVRSKDYGDILLEEYSIWEQRVPGWVSGEKVTTYITYIIEPTGKIDLLPFLLLQRAWQENYHHWLEKYERKFARNRTYVTSNIPVPRDVLYEALFKAGQIPFTITKRAA